MKHRFILAISTSSGVAKVAAAIEPVSPEQLATKLFNFEIADYKSQSMQLLPLIQQNMLASNLEAQQCAAVAVDVGPGGFTSLRTACGVAQGLALAWNVPTVPITSFECMLPTHFQEDPVTVLMDARLNEIYTSKIQRTANGTLWVDAPYLLPMEALQTLSSPAVCDKLLYEKIVNPPNGVVLGEVCAIRLAQLAWQEFEANRLATPFDCQPLYVRDKVAQTTTERQALKHGAV